jgi:predicted nucleic acid-binding Zn ribbon protein
MATYVYETIPQLPGDAVRRFEAQQSMKDAPLTRDPETGLPVKRVILGGYGIMTKGAAASSLSDGPGCENGACEMPARPSAHVCGHPACCRN